MQPIIVDASPIREAVGTTVDVSLAADLDPVDVSGVVYAPMSPADIIATLTNSGEGLVLHGNVRAVFEVECSRCLKAIPFEIGTDIDTVFVDAGASADDDDQDIVVFTGDQIDVAPIVESALRVEMPLAPVCDLDCKGICADCGANLNERSCDCHEKPDEDHPFAALKELLPEEPEQS